MYCFPSRGPRLVAIDLVSFRTTGLLSFTTRLILQFDIMLPKDIKPLIDADGFGEWMHLIKKIIYQHFSNDGLTDQDLGQEENKELALNMVITSVHSSLGSIISKCQGPAEAIKTLQNHLFPNTDAQHLQIHDQIDHLTYQGVGMMDLFIHKLDHLFEKLKYSGAQINPRDVMAVVFAKLPQEYIKFTRPYQSKEWSSLSQFYDHLRSVDRIIVARKDAKQNAKCEEQNQMTDTDYIVRCFQCGELGHKRSKCDSI